MDRYYYAKNIPESLRRLRFPPNGDVDEWVKYGPGGRDNPDDRVRPRLLTDHACVANEPGADCRICGFPWWTIDGRSAEKLT